MVSVVWGASGAMGRLICGILGEEAAGKVSPSGGNGSVANAAGLEGLQPDVVIDFSHHSAVPEVLAYARKVGAAVVIGTTGHTGTEKALILEASREIPVFFSGNMSMGIAVLCRLAKEAAKCFPEADIEIVEIHHNRKVDAPSGTALMLYNAVKEARPEATPNCGRSGEGKRTKAEIGISSLRMGSVVGIHEVHIHTGSQILTLKHEAVTRSMFADGAVEAARFLAGKGPGLYTMEDMLG